MPTVRVEITDKVVKKVAGMAAVYVPPERKPGEKWKEPPSSLWADTRERHLMIRLRGRDASWMSRTRGKTRVIGDIRERHPGYLSIRAARDAAAALVGKIADGEEDAGAGAPKGRGWTWKDLDAAYQAAIAPARWINNRSKPPSKGTCDDIRLAFARPSFVAMHGKKLTKLDRPTVTKARNAIESFRQRQKNVAYLKAALSWAANEHPDESGLTEKVDRWWEHLKAGSPDPETQKAIETRRAVHRQRKADLDIGHIAEVLVRHEAYCEGRTAEDKISPGIRFGLWWVSTPPIVASRPSSSSATTSWSRIRSEIQIGVAQCGRRTR